ncbi:hypothetical protein ACLIA0_10245 [Bacillaceae bacterium W0354]
MKKILSLLILFCTIMFYGCNANETRQNDDPFRQLSTDDSESSDELYDITQREFNGDYQSELEPIDDLSPSEDIPFTENNEQQEPRQGNDPNEINQGRMGIDNQIVDEEKLTTYFQLPFNEFQARWNALTDEQLSNLYIREINNDSENKYVTTINSYIALQLENVNNDVQQIKIVSKPQTKEQILKMLTAWQQAIQVMYPELEIHDVDRIFSEIGIEPDANLSKLKNKTFTHNHLIYDISINENQYILNISFSS